MPLGKPLMESEPHIKVVYYGNPGSGKTTAMASLAKLGKVAAIDFEGTGWISMSLRKRGIPVENVHLFQPRTYKELEQVYWEIKGMIEDDIGLVGVCVDHLTELESILVREASTERIDKARRKLLGNGSKEALAVIEGLDEFVTELQDYGKWTNQARKLIRMFRDLPIHVAFGAHVRGDGAKLVPALTEKFRNDLLGSMNMVIATYVDEINGKPEYLGATREVKRYVGKDRFDVTRPLMVHPHMDRLTQLVYGELDLDSDPVTLAFKQRIGAE